MWVMGMYHQYLAGKTIVKKTFWNENPQSKFIFLRYNHYTKGTANIFKEISIMLEYKTKQSQYRGLYEQGRLN